MTLDEVMPGGDTWTRPDTTYFTDAGPDAGPDAGFILYSHGAMAVDPRDETVLIEHEKTTGRGTQQSLVAIRGTSSRIVANLDGLDNVRVLFPEDSVLVLGETDSGRDELRVLEPGSLSERDRVEGLSRYSGTRLSGSKRYLIVAANERSPSPLHLIDTRTLEVVEIELGAYWLEAMWLHDSDVLAAIAFYEEGGEYWTRLLAWDVKSLESITAFEGAMPPAIYDVRVDDAREDLLFSFSWVGVSPDDSRIVYPVRQIDELGNHEPQLLVVDMADGNVRRVPGRGPVGFTPDSSTIVSYSFGGAGSTLAMIDAETLETEEVPVPIEAPEFYVPRTGAFVVVASASQLTEGAAPIIVYDADTGRSTTVGYDVRFEEFVARDDDAELWMIDHGLHRLGYMAMELERIDLPFTPHHIQRLPTSDLLVLDDVAGPTIHFWDPETRRDVRTARLPE